MPKPAYKAGDKVVILRNSNNHCFKIGSVVTITEYHAGIGLYGGTFLYEGNHRKNSGGNIREYDLAPYNPNSIRYKTKRTLHMPTVTMAVVALAFFVTVVQELILPIR